MNSLSCSSKLADAKTEQKAVGPKNQERCNIGSVPRFSL
jgi:hypothetical protein